MLSMQRALLAVAASFVAGLVGGVAQGLVADSLTDRAAAGLTLLLRTREL